MSTLSSYIPLLMQGTAITVIAWITAGIISVALGTVIGVLGCRYLVSSPIAAIIKVYTFIAKGIPAYVQILIVYFVLPSLLGINIPGFIAAIAALAFCSSGYVTEIVRSGINTVSSGQWEACTALGYPLSITIRRIILPQTVRNILPALIGEGEQLLKSTSLLAIIGITELTRTGMNIISRELNPLPIYFTIAGIYLFFSAILQLLMIYTERKIYGYR